MLEIWKFGFIPQDSIEIIMPTESKVLSVQVQNEQPCIWALVNPKNLKKVKKFNLRGTGQPMYEDPGNFIGTFQMLNGSLVFHLFEEKK